MRALAFAVATAILTLAAKPAGAQYGYIVPSTTTRHSLTPSACGEGRWGRDALRFRLERLMFAIDSTETAHNRIFRLPVISPDSIRIVTDERICERAARLYYRDHLGPRPLESVAVAQVGDFYVVYGARRAGEWTLMDIYTRDFELIVTVTS